MKMTIGVLAMVAVLLLAVPAPSVAYDNGLGQLPPLGWSTWCTDDICGLIDICTENEIQTIADAFVSSGMKDIGYEWLVLDDCWASKERDADGNLQPDAKQFPSGMPALVDYVHERGLKIGLYTCAGNYTCHDGRPGSYGHYKEDAETFAKWDIDYVKMDNCFHPHESPQIYYTQFSKALNATGHEMWFNTCEWGEDDPWTWAGEIAQSFRVGPDHLPFWKFNGQGVYDYIERMATLAHFSKEFAWGDADFLMTGMPPMSNIDSETEFSFWALWAAPMIISTDVRNMDAWKKSVVLNKDILDVNQDLLRIPGSRVVNGTSTQVWKKPLTGGDLAVILFNADDHNNQTVSITWEKLGLASDATYTGYDLWRHESIGNLTGSFSSSVLPHGVRMIRLMAN